VASVRPVFGVSARVAAAAKSGKVAPSSTDCGRISTAAIVHFTTTSIDPPASAGKIVSYASALTRPKTSWNASPSSPTASSTIAYQSSGSASCAERLDATVAPSDMPPRKITSTITCAYALCPTSSPR
jgi:hypothetical protein